MAAKSTIQPFVVSFGVEDFFLDRDLNLARSWKGRSLIQVDGTEVTDEELVSICETRGFDGGDRVVIVDDAHKMKGDKALKTYIEGKSATDESVVLVAIVRSEKLPEVWGQAAKKGKLIEHKKLKTYESNNEVVKWITSEAFRRELGLEKGIPEMLFQTVGADLYRLNGELQKLLLLVGKGNKAGLAHLKLVLAPSPSAEPYQVAEAVLERDPKKALNALSLVYRSMGEEAHVPISFSLIKQVEKLMVARYLLDQKASEDEIATAIGMHPWRCKTYFLPQAKKHSLAHLTSILGVLRRLDADVKGAARSKRTRVELAVLAITG